MKPDLSEQKWRWV